MTRFFLYIAGLSLITFLANTAYVASGLYADDIAACNAGLVYRMDSLKQNTGLLYFGESSDFTAAEHDSSKQSISELVAQLQPEIRVGHLSQGAIHASTYKTLIGRLDEYSTVKTVVVTMNLRSFGVNWIESELETNLSRAEIIYSRMPPVLKKLFLTLKAYDNLPLFKRKERIKSHYRHDKFNLKHLPYSSVYEWDKVVFNKGLPGPDGTKDQGKTDIACHFIKNYAVTIDDRNPRIRDFDAIVDLCREKHLTLVFHVLPENYERAGALCGQDLVDLMDLNVQFLKQRYGQASVFIDNHRLLADSIFIDRGWPTEHYSFAGRYQVAKTISAALAR